VELVTPKEKCVSKVKTPYILNILEKEYTTLLSGLFTAEGRTPHTNYTAERF
jgi:hypothetical protein